MTREAKIEEEFYRLASNILEKKKYVIEGVKFDPIEPQYPVDSGRADLMLPIYPNKPFLIIECKRKVAQVKGIFDLRNFDPMSSRVIAQSLGYAVQSGTPLFATTNGRIFALFTVPKKGEAFRIDRHRLLIKEIRMNEEVFLEILPVVARWKAGLKFEKTPVEWTFIIRLRSFVDYLSEQLLPAVNRKLKVDKSFKLNYDRFSKERGNVTSDQYSRESAYILMNKIIFYKILERYYGNLSKLLPLEELEDSVYMDKLKEHFNEAMVITKDFEPIFSTGIYDDAPIPDQEVVLDEINSFIEDMDTYRLEEIASDIVGFIYERLIPDEERHRLGQFYTPPQIAELITRWSIKEPTDRILDPACGSGTFSVKAYKLLQSLRPLREVDIHKKLLSQIYCIDINPFPAHLTAVNLAMRDVRHPTYEVNILVEDFFNIAPNQKYLAPFSIKAVTGDLRREISIPAVDALVGNPPYTTWKEIPKNTRRSILHELRETMYNYDVRPQLRAGLHPGIHMYFVMHGARFLRNGGRLGLIISNSWLQSDIGISFGSFLLDNFKIRAVIDFSSRLFSIPLVATCVILLENCDDKKARDENKTSFMFIDNQISVDDILSLLSKPSYKDISVVGIKQKEIPRDQKWIGIATGSTKIKQLIEKNKYFVKASKLFRIFRGTIDFVSRTSGGVGADAFFYLDNETVKLWGIQEYVVKLLPSPRYSRFYSFDNDDWKKLREKGSKCYLFLCNSPRNKLPKPAFEYVRWGESQCRNRSGVLCSKAKACQAREKSKLYEGWYDLGSVKNASIFAGRYGQYLRRFMVMRGRFALDDGLVAFQSKVRLNTTQIKAILTYLNSSFGQFFVEFYGQTTGGGMVSIDKIHAGDILIPDVRKTSKKETEKLARIFDELDQKARSIGGADRKSSMEKIMPITRRINTEIAAIFKLPSSIAKEVENKSEFLMQRRMTRGRKAKPETIVGAEPPRMRPPTDLREREGTTLDKWIRNMEE